MTNDELELQRREQTRRDIEDDAQRWADGFGGLDERALPLDLQKAAQDDGPIAEYDRHGFPTYDTRGLGGNGKNALKQWLTAIEKGEIDDSTAEYLAKETGDPSLHTDHIDRVATKIATAWVQANPDYLPINSNFEAMREELAAIADLPSNATIRDLYDAGVWDAAHFDQAYENLKAAGELEFPAGMFRPLSEKQKHIVRTRLALGSIPEAITHYLAYAKGTHPDVIAFTSPQVFLNDPANLPVIRECLAFVFAELHPEFVATPARVDFLLNWCGSRFPTLALLTSGWNRLQQLEQQEAARTERHQLVYGDVEDREEVPIAEALDDMSDSEIDSLLRRTRIDAAKRSRRSPGIIL